MEIVSHPVFGRTCFQRHASVPAIPLRPSAKIVGTAALRIRKTRPIPHVVVKRDKALPDNTRHLLRTVSKVPHDSIDLICSRKFLPPGKSGKWVVFDTPPSGIIIAGLYPPVRAIAKRPLDNRTSIGLRKVIGAGKTVQGWEAEFAWCDLLPLSPDDLSADLNQAALEREFRTRTPLARRLLADWIERLRQCIAQSSAAAGGCEPTVVWAGLIVNYARAWAVEDGLLSGEGIPLFRTGLLEVAQCEGFRSIAHAVHPSWGLVSRGLPSAMDAVSETYRAVGILSDHRVRSAEALFDVLGEESRARQSRLESALNELGLPHDAGWLEQTYAHLRYAVAGDTSLPLFRRLRQDLGKATFLHVCKRSLGDHIEKPSYVETLLEWHAKLGQDRFVTFMSNSVAARLHEPDFQQLLEDWHAKLGNDRFVTFMSNSVAARLHEPHFQIACLKWLSLLGPDRFPALMTGGVACRIADPAFQAKLTLWLIEHKRSFYFVRANLKRLLDPDFEVAELARSLRA